MHKFEEIIRNRIQESMNIEREMIKDISTVKKIAETIISAYRGDKKIILFGNGGSAADAQHIAAELIGKYYLDRESLPAIALTVNTSSLTALGNDYSFDIIFARQLEAIGKTGDVIIGLSTSGNSNNIVEALKIANKEGIIYYRIYRKTGG